MNNISYLDKHVLAKGHVVVYFTVTGYDGSQKYYYISMRADKLEPFSKSAEKGKIKINDFDGIILQEGNGVPSKSIQDFMYKQYGVAHIN